MNNNEKSAIENIKFNIKYRHLSELKKRSVYERAACKVIDLNTLLDLVKRQDEIINTQNKMLEKIADKIHDPEEFIPGCSLFECDIHDDTKCVDCIIKWARNEVDAECTK